MFLQNSLMGYSTLCSCSFQVTLPNLSWSQTILNAVIHLWSCLLYWPHQMIRRASLPVSRCSIFMVWTDEAYLRFEVMLFVIILLLFMGFYLLIGSRSISKWGEVSKSVFHLFWKRGGHYRFLCHPMHHGMFFATFSDEMSVSSDISSQSRVTKEMAKLWPSSTGVDSLANILFLYPPVPCPARFSSRVGSGWISTSNIAFWPFDSWF